MLGRTLSRYCIVSEIGSGGMGVVYRAHDASLDRDVALKVLPAATSFDPHARARLIREARTASRLNHPGICTIHEVGEDEGTIFVAMELVEGRSLSELIRERTLSPDDVVRYGIQIAEALEHAHGRNVIHRDLKSSNVMITSEGRVKVLDFGLAKRIQEGGDLHASRSSSTLTHTGTLIGTPQYLPPEVLAGAVADARSDLWALGVMLYEMATGRLPFEGATLFALIASIMNEATPALPDRIPPELSAVLHQCLEKSPSMRYQSASDLKKALGNTGTTARATPVVIRRRFMRAIRAVLASALVAVPGWMAWRHFATPPQTERALTTNPVDLGVLTASISPDGKYIVYSDTAGVYLREIANGETRNVPMPRQGTRAMLFSWFPDASRFLLASSDATNDTLATEIWEISLLGWNSRKLRDGGWGPAVSPDGSRVAFWRNGIAGREIWVMTKDGGGARRIVAMKPGELGASLTWAPSGQHLAYLYFLFKPDSISCSIRCLDIDRGSVSTLLEDPRLVGQYGGGYGLAWLPGDRIAFARAEPASSQGMNLWTARVDVARGRIVGSPRKETDWTGFYIAELSSTRDGKHLSYLRQIVQFDVYVGDLDASGRLTGTRRLTLDNREDRANGWLTDGRTVLLSSDRHGNDDVFRQSIDRPTPDVVIQGPGHQRWAKLSPDGAWILYREIPADSPATRIMRLPVGGGSIEEVPNTTEVERFNCPSRPGKPCIASRPQGDQVVFSELDPIRGILRTIRSVPVAESEYAWDISADGTRIALIDQAHPGQIRVLDLQDGSTKPIRLHGVEDERQLGSLSDQSIAWSAAGDGFFIGSFHALLHADLGGRERVVYRTDNWLGLPMPSPDGRRLAFTLLTNESNAWLIDHF